MARTRVAIEKTPGWKIYQELLTYTDGQQMIPNVNAFFEYLVKRKVFSPEDKSLYRYYMERRLVDDGLIYIDHDMRSIRILKRQIVPIEDNVDETESEPIVKRRLQDW